MNNDTLDALDDVLKHETMKNTDSVKKPLLDGSKAPKNNANANPGTNLSLKDSSDTDQDVGWWSTELRDMKFSQLLVSVQKRLNPFEKKLSKFMHHDSIDTISEINNKIFTRSTGILVGGGVALIATTISYLLAKHIGGEFNPSIVLLAYIGGYVLGTLFEFLTKAFRRLRR